MDAVGGQHPAVGVQDRGGRVPQDAQGSSSRGGQGRPGRQARDELAPESSRAIQGAPAGGGERRDRGARHRRRRQGAEGRMGTFRGRILRRPPGHRSHHGAAIHGAGGDGRRGGRPRAHAPRAREGPGHLPPGSPPPLSLAPPRGAGDSGDQAGHARHPHRLPG